MPGWVRVQAPVRVLDAGGWTDTWFAHGGAVCHLAVDDGVEVSAGRDPGGGEGKVQTAQLYVQDFNERYRFPLEDAPGRHPLLEAAIRRWAPPHGSVDVTVASFVPPGSGLGTSASVLVALIAALQALTGSPLEPHALARAAHEIETVDLGLQSGVQDQIAAAYGGSNLITIHSYPDVEVQPLELAAATWDALTRRMVTVYLGGPHRSNDMHEAVIEHLAGTDGEKYLAPLRAAAHEAALALLGGDLERYGQALIANTDAQTSLHPALVSPLAHQVFRMAGTHGAAGWKVNGAGGEGGTVSLVGPHRSAELVTALNSIAGVTVLPLRPARGGARVVDRRR